MVLPKIRSIGRTYRYINRYREIITILSRYGFGEFLASTQLDKYVDLGKKLILRRSSESEHLSRWQRVRMVVEELGPVFIKFGQIMSNRQDMLPDELVKELEPLQDAVPPFPVAQVYELVEKELGFPVGEVFREFQEEPLAAASIAQVHRATLQDGTEVVVKVQRPGIERVVEADLEIMNHLAVLVQRHIEMAAAIDPVAIVKEFERVMKRELNFLDEASNIQRFRRNFQTEREIFVPQVFRQYSSRKILVMSFVDGIKVSNVGQLRQAGLDPKVIAARGARLILKQIFEHGFFHADPHPGNIMVLKDNVVCYIDFGMMGYLASGMRQSLSKIVVGIVNKDEKKITQALRQIARDGAKFDANQLQDQVAELVERHFYQPLKDINVAEMLSQLIGIFGKNHLRMPPDMYLLLKALITTEGIAREMDPEFDMISHIRPFARKIIAERFRPDKLAKRVYMSAGDMSYWMLDLPENLNEITEMIKQGRVKIEFEHKGLEPALKSHEHVSNRIAFSIVVAALIIGSSLIVLSKIPPVWHGIPIIGILGFSAAGVMGFWLLISIMRHGKL